MQAKQSSHQIMELKKIAKRIHLCIKVENVRNVSNYASTLKISTMTNTQLLKLREQMPAFNLHFDKEHFH